MKYLTVALLAGSVGALGVYLFADEPKPKPPTVVVCLCAGDQYVGEPEPIIVPHEPLHKQEM